MRHNKTIALVIAAALIIIAIVYIESTKINLAPKKNTIAQDEKNLAPELQGIEGYINAQSNLTLKSLRGKVVLIDFWTYSCINCIRTQPYLNTWNERYKDDGLVIIGVHTPEFNFEKVYDNVEKAVKKEGIQYPVVLDNNYATWNAFDNHYWPRKYLIDSKGKIRYDHIGEGAYDETEMKIQELLMERNESMKLSGTSKVTASSPGAIGTPEIYLGYQTSRGNFGNSEQIIPEVKVNYTLPPQANFNNVYFSGEWTIREDSMELSEKEGIVILAYFAGSVNIVAGSNSSSSVQVFFDGKQAGSDAGADVNNGVAVISEDRLYNLVQTNTSGAHIITLNISGDGFKLYTFTFG